MRCMILVKASKDSEAGVLPTTELLTKMGKFNEELVAGFWLWQVRSIEEAVEWIKRSPFGPGAEVEIRPVFEAEDFSPNLTPELKQQEDRLRDQMSEKKSSKTPKKSFDALSIL